MPRRSVARTLGWGAVAGLGHVALVLAAIVGLFGGEVPAPPDPLEHSGAAFWYAFTAVGLVLVGLVPAVLVLEARLVAPALAVATGFAWGVQGTWLALQSPNAPVGPTAFGWYLLAWFLVLAVALLAGSVEFAARRLGRALSLPRRLPARWRRPIAALLYLEALAGLVLGIVVSAPAPLTRLAYPVVAVGVAAVAVGLGRVAGRRGPAGEHRPSDRESTH